MTNTFCTARACGQPSPASTLCSDCLAVLKDLLSQAGWIVEQLRNTQTGQQRFSERVGSRTKDSSSIPYNPKASDVLTDYGAVLARWQARIADHLGQPVRYPSPVSAALWIEQAISPQVGPGIATFIDAGQLLDELNSAHRRAVSTFNRPRQGWFAGICSAPLPNGDECQRSLYANNEDGELTCPSCGAQHDMATRRLFLLEAAREVDTTATEAARAIKVLSEYEDGKNRVAKNIVMWNQRGRLKRRGTTPDGRPLYRLGDILDLINQQVARERKTA